MKETHLNKMLSIFYLHAFLILKSGIISKIAHFNIFQIFIHQNLIHLKISQRQ